STASGCGSAPPNRSLTSVNARASETNSPSIPVARIWPFAWLSAAAGARTVTTRSFTGAGRPGYGSSTLDDGDAIVAPDGLDAPDARKAPDASILLSVKSGAPLDKWWPAFDSSSILSD